MRINDSVAVTVTNGVGNTLFVGTGVVKGVKLRGYITDYSVLCDDGKTREVSRDNPEYRKDRIMII